MTDPLGLLTDLLFFWGFWVAVFVAGVVVYLALRYLTQSNRRR